MPKETDYESLFHLMNQRRGAELRKLVLIILKVSELMEMFKETDCLIEDNYGLDE